MLEQRIAEVESRHEDYVWENIDTETSINCIEMLRGRDEIKRPV